MNRWANECVNWDRQSNRMGGQIDESLYDDHFAKMPITGQT
jgi:hypothetical protein